MNINKKTNKRIIGVVLAMLMLSSIAVAVTVSIIGIGILPSGITVQSRPAFTSSDSVGNNAPNVKVSALPATYGMVDERIYTFPKNMTNGWYSITNYTFYLPANAYTNIEVRGVEGGMMATGLYFGIDQPDPCKGDTATMVTYEHPDITIGVHQFGKNTPMQTSRVYYLGKGYHTVYVNVLANTGGIDMLNLPTVSPVTVSITATSSGNMQIKR